MKKNKTRDIEYELLFPGEKDLPGPQESIDKIRAYATGSWIWSACDKCTSDGGLRNTICRDSCTGDSISTTTNRLKNLCVITWKASFFLPEIRTFSIQFVKVLCRATGSNLIGLGWKTMNFSRS